MVDQLSRQGGLHLVSFVAEVVVLVQAGSLEPPEGEVLVRLDLAQQALRRGLVIRDRKINKELEKILFFNN